MAKHLAAAIVCVACVSVCANEQEALAQCDYSLTTHVSGELDGGGWVNALTIFDDGSGPALVAGGSELLETLDSPGDDFYHIVKWHPTTGWAPLGALGDMHHTRQLLVVDDQLHASTSSEVRRWDGTQWLSIGEGLSGSLREMIVYDDGSGTGPALFILTIISGPPYESRMLKLEEGMWRPVAEFAQVASTLEVFGGELVVGGSFTSVDDLPMKSIAKWDGQQWTGLGGGVEGRVSDLMRFTLQGVPVLVASGSFTSAGEGPAEDIAYWDGSEWTALPSTRVEFQEGMGVLAEWDDGRGNALYATSTHEEQSSGDRYDTLFKLDESAGQWVNLGTGYSLPSSGISCLQPFQEGLAKSSTLFVAGKFERFGGVQTPNLARILPQPGGGVEPMPSDPTSLRGSVTSFAKNEHDGESALYAGGSIRGLFDDPRQSTLVARFNGDAWVSVGHGSGRVYTLKTLDDGSGPALYAAGNYYSIEPNNGKVPTDIARWDGINWIKMGAPGDTVYAICVHDDGSGPAIYHGSSGGIVAKWNAGTATWTPISPAFTYETSWGSVRALVSFDDGSGPALYAAGHFTTVAGVPVNRIARWRGPSLGWSAVGGGLPSSVTALHVHDDGSIPRLIANGGGNQFGGLAQWDGATWSAVGSLQSIGLANNVRAITTFDDGSGPALMIGTYQRIARWNGTVWAMLPRVGEDVMFADGDVLYAGNPFSIWAPGGDSLAINDIAGGGSFEPGSSVALDAKIVQGGVVTFAWRHNGAPVTNAGNYSGAFTDRLRFSNINGSHDGVYELAVSNDCETVISEPVMVDVIGTCVGDVAVNGVVDEWDLLAIVGAWGVCSQSWSCPADLTHDGVVNVADLLTAIVRWGSCP